MERILFVAESGPLPAIDGKRQRTLALLQALEKKYAIDYLVIDNERDYLLAKKECTMERVNFLAVNGHDTTLQARLAKKAGLLFTLNKPITDLISELVKRHAYQFIFTRYAGPIRYVPHGVKIVCDVDDDFAEQYKTRIAQAKGLFKKIRLYQVYACNAPAFAKLKRRAAKLIFVKANDIAGNSILLPNLPFQLLNEKELEWKACQESRLLYVGKLSYRPNAEGLKWFLQEVWPVISEGNKMMKLSVISSEETTDAALQKLLSETDRVHYLGRVESLPEVYRAHAVIIAPVFSGGGSNIKIAEALFMGRPVVTTTFGARGFADASDAGYIMSADNPECFKDRIIDLLKDEDKLTDLQKRLRAWATSNYFIAQWEERLYTALDNL